MLGICEACGTINNLIRHHWYDTDTDCCDDNILGNTVKNSPWVLIIGNKPILYYHERRICLKCNRLLLQQEIRYFKGGGIKPFKSTDDSHIMPTWNIQKAFALYRKSLIAKMDEI